MDAATSRLLRTDLQPDRLPDQQGPRVLLPFIEDYLRTMVRPAFAAMLATPWAFKKSNRKSRTGRMETIILDPSPPSTMHGWDSRAVVAAFQAELRNARPNFGVEVDPFQMTPEKRLGIVWIDQPPDTSSPSRQQEHVAGLRERFPGWDVWDYYAGCPVREEVLIAQQRGYSHHSVYHTGMYPSQCPGVRQSTGACGFRVMPEFMLWRAKGDPPRTADLLILDAWPDADSRWSVDDLRKTARDAACRSIAPLLTALADLCEIGASREGPAIALGLEHRVDLFRVGQAWRTGGRKQAHHDLVRLPVPERPKNPVWLVDAVLEDERTWHQQMGAPLKVRVIGGKLAVQRGEGRIPDVLTEKPSIDLTGRARRHKLDLVRYGIRVVTAEEILAGLEPPKVPRAERRATQIERLEEIVERYLSYGVIPEKQAVAYEMGLDKKELSRRGLREAFEALIAAHKGRKAA